MHHQQYIPIGTSSELANEATWLQLSRDEIEQWEEVLVPVAEKGSLGARLMLAQKARLSCDREEQIGSTRRALAWMGAAAEEWSHPMALFWASRLAGGLHMATKGEDEDTAFAWLQKAAEAGHAKAAFNVGLAYAQGDRAAEDETKAAQWVRYANSLGYDPKNRCEIITHPKSIKRNNVKGIAKSDKELPELVLPEQSYASLLHRSNYLAGLQYE